MPIATFPSTPSSGWSSWSFASEISVNDIATIFLLLVAIATFLMNYFESRKKNHTERMLFVKDLLEPFRTEPDISSAFYKIEYHQFHYNFDTFHDSALEKEIDKLLSHCNLVCSFYKNRIITEKEFNQFRYYMVRIAGNSGIKDYFEFLDGWSKRAEVKSNFDEFRTVTTELLK